MDVGYSSVVRLAECHFFAIRQSVAVQAAPATLKAAFLEPASNLATQLFVHLFARTDLSFMNLFAAFTSTEVSRVVCAVAQCIQLGYPQDLNGHWTSNQEPSM